MKTNKEEKISEKAKTESQTVSEQKNKQNKKNLGQFMTTNYEYILQNMYIPNDIENVIEPFAGSGDLLKFVNKEEEKRKKKFNIECFDIDPKKDYINKLDTLLNPPSYENKFIITNPPYLARNKSEDKKYFDIYDVNDLYKCHIKNILTNQCLGGIFIIPLNFWCSIRKSDIDLRKDFLEKYNILLINLFEEKVFDDTTYTICSFQFEKKKDISFEVSFEKKCSVVEKQEKAEKQIKMDIYPSKKSIEFELNDSNNYIIGGWIYNLPLKNNFKINRLTKKNKKTNHTNILVKCIDDNELNKINYSIVSDKDIYIDNTDNLSCRTYATLVIEPTINLDKQKKLVEKCNEFLEINRDNYHSLFLTNYRESKDIARKRISFELIYNIVEYILDQMD